MSEKWHNFDFANLFWYMYEYRYLKCKKVQWGEKCTQEVHWGVIKLFSLLSDFPRDIIQKAGKNVIACMHKYKHKNKCESLECKHKHKHEAIMLSLLTRILAFHWFTLEHNNLIFFFACAYVLVWTSHILMLESISCVKVWKCELLLIYTLPFQCN